MKRAYQVTTMVGNNLDRWEYMVVSDNAEKACKVAIRQAEKDSGYKTIQRSKWRVVSLVERSERPIL